MDILIAASAANLANLNRGLGGPDGMNLALHELELSEPLPDELLSGAKILVIEVDPREQASLARLDRVRTLAPHTPVIVGLAHADIGVVRTLLRRGVNDVVTLPFDEGELFDRIVDASAQAVEAEPVRLCPMLAVISAAAGGGASTAIAHLAAAFGDHTGGNICVIDIDVQTGLLAHFIGANPAVTVQDLLDASDRLDSDMVRDAAFDTGHGFRLIAAPNTFEPIENVPLDVLQRLLTEARSQFDLVIVDLPSSWPNWAMAVLAGCERIMFLTDPSLRALRLAKRRMEAFREVGIDASRISMVLNRARKGLFGSVNSSSVEETLGVDVVATLPLQERELEEAQDQGVLIHELSTKSPYARAISDATGHVWAKMGGDAP